MHPVISKAFDRAIAWKSGRHFHARLREFQEMETWSAETFQRWQWERLRDLLDHAYRSVPYWRERMKELGAKPEDFRTPAHLAQLPTTTKEIINANREAMVSTQPPVGRVTHKSTGGSTGRNVWFYVDMDTHDRRRAAGRLFELWDGVVPGTPMVSLWGASLETEPSRASRVYDRVTNRLFLSVYGVGDEELSSHFDRMERFRPEVIVTYPSILRHIARRMGRERCRRIGARLIYTSAEALYPSVREELEESFGAKVRNRYAAREFGMIAGDCPKGEGLYLAEMRMFFEFLPALGEDSLSEMVITDLDARAMPMIRYRIDDLGTPLAGADPAGRPWRRLAAVDGRSMDVVVTPEGKAFGGTFFTLIFRPYDQSILQFQVIQDAEDHLDLRIVPGEGYDQEHREQLLAVLREQLGERIRIDLSEHEEIPPLASGKRRFVVSTIGGARADEGAR